MRIPPALIKKEPLWRRIAIVVGIAILAGCAIRAIAKSGDGDFKLHWETGRRFLTGEFLYANGHDFPYPPFLGMTFAPAALLPMPVAKAVFYPVGIAALILLLWILRRVVQSAFLLNETGAFWTAVFAVVLALQFLIRDQAELGFNTVITALIWLSVDLWRQRRNLFAGLSLGAAIAIKCTPAIFLAYFVWKRQWRVALCTAAATLVFTVAPIARQGADSWTHHMKTWTANAIEGISGAGSSAGANEYFAGVTNMSLRPALMRYLTGSGFLPQTVANWTVTALMLVLFGIFLWGSRWKIVTRDDSRILWELAAVGVLMLLLSPITWRQHCVALLPACYLIVALLGKCDRLPRWIILLVSVYALFCVILGRDLIGRDQSLVLASLHFATFAIAGLLAILLAGPRLVSTR